MKSPDFQIDEVFENVRQRTNTSLATERTKTDESLAEEQCAAEARADQLLNSNRVQADLAQSDERRNLDASKEKARSAPGIRDLKTERQIDDLNLAHERSANDVAQKLERTHTDAAVNKERRRLRLAAAALFAMERGATDADLSGERARVDSEVELVGLDLSQEVSAHNQTKALMDVLKQDLQYPLENVLKAGDLLQSSLVSEKIVAPEIHRLLGVMRRNASVMDRFLTDLADLELLNAGKLPMRSANENLEDVLAECNEVFGDLASTKSVNFETKIIGGPLIAHFDRERILQVLSDLIGNALKHTPKDGAILVKGCHTNGQLEISVTDTGRGIPLADQTQIFNKFFALSKSRQGMGIGLHIAKAIVEAHGGTISVESQVGEGSTFRFNIPLSQA